MNRPCRIQLRRTKGWRLPPNAVKVDRSTPWGNPFRIGEPGIPDAETAVWRYREWILGASDEAWALRDSARDILSSRNLACWCPPGQPCHADVLLEIANA